jgi:hypothetical protein
MLTDHSRLSPCVTGRGESVAAADAMKIFMRGAAKEDKVAAQNTPQRLR